MVDACTQLSAAVQSRADALCVCVCVRVCVCVCRNMLPGIDNLRPCTQLQRSKRLPFPPMPLVMERDFVCLCLCLCDRVSVCLCVLDGSLPALYPPTQLSQEQMCVCVCVCVCVLLRFAWSLLCCCSCLFTTRHDALPVRCHRANASAHHH